MKKQSISGTGNGISIKYLPDLLSSLEEYSRLLASIAKVWKVKIEKEGSVFSGQYHAITNWHDPYKIDIPMSEMPKKLIDTYEVRAGFTYTDTVRVGIHLPTKVKCSHFGGGEGTGGTVLFAELGIRDVNTFAKDESFSGEFRKLVLQELLEQYEAKNNELYIQKIKSLKQLIKNNSIEIEQMSKDNIRYVDELTIVEEKLNELKKLT